MVKYLPIDAGGLDPWVRKIPWKRKWQPTPVFLPGESLGQRSLVGSVQGSQRVVHNLVTEHKTAAPRISHTQPYKFTVYDTHHTGIYQCL